MRLSTNYLKGEFTQHSKQRWATTITAEITNSITVFKRKHSGAEGEWSTSCVNSQFWKHSVLPEHHMKGTSVLLFSTLALAGSFYSLLTASKRQHHKGFQWLSHRHLRQSGSYIRASSLIGESETSGQSIRRQKNIAKAQGLKGWPWGVTKLVKWKLIFIEQQLLL